VQCHNRTGKGTKRYTASRGYTPAQLRRVGGGGIINNKNPAIGNSSSLNESVVAVFKTMISDQTVTQNSATFPVYESVAEYSGSTSQTSKYVDVDSSSWPIETEPDFQVFMAYVDSASCTFNEEAILLQEDYYTMRALFPACVQRLNEGRWWRMDLVLTFMSTICNSIDTFYFDWGERKLQRTTFSDTLEKMTGHFKVYITVNINKRIGCCSYLKGQGDCTLCQSLSLTVLHVTNEHPKVK
jgi:hypothetical protein